MVPYHSSIQESNRHSSGATSNMYREICSRTSMVTKSYKYALPMGAVPLIFHDFSWIACLQATLTGTAAAKHYVHLLSETTSLTFGAVTVNLLTVPSSLNPPIDCPLFPGRRFNARTTLVSGSQASMVTESWRLQVRG